MTSYTDMFFADLSLKPGKNTYEFQTGGNSTLELILPNVSVKEIRGQIWHASEVIEPETKDPFSKLVANNGYTEFNYIGTADPAVPLQIPALPSGSFFAQIWVRPVAGALITVDTPIELSDNMITTVDLRQSDSSEP